MGHQRRIRAVQLTDEGLDLLKKRLLKEWQELGLEGRLTRAARAGLMDVSIATSERILGQKGNDRSVLIHVFDRLGLAWDDRFCKFWTPDAKTDVSLTPDAGERSEEFAPPRRGPGRALALPVAGVFVATVLLVGAVSALDFVDLWKLRRDHQLTSRELKSGVIKYSAGDYEGARVDALSALGRAQGRNFADAMAEAMRLNGDVLAAEGRLEEAIQDYEGALNLWTVFPSTHGRASALEMLGVAEARFGRLDDAERHLKASLALRREINDPGGVAGVSRGLGSVAAIRGDTAAAKRWYEAATVTLAAHPDVAMMTDIRAMRALLLSDEGQFSQALKELLACLQWWEERGHRRWEATTLLQMASVHAAAGDLDSAGRIARTARERFSQVGDGLGVLECDRLLQLGALAATDLHLRTELYF